MEFLWVFRPKNEECLPSSFRLPVPDCALSADGSGRGGKPKGPGSRRWFCHKASGSCCSPPWKKHVKRGVQRVDNTINMPLQSHQNRDRPNSALSRCQAGADGADCFADAKNHSAGTGGRYGNIVSVCLKIGSRPQSE